MKAKTQVILSSMFFFALCLCSNSLAFGVKLIFQLEKNTMYGEMTWKRLGAGNVPKLYEKKIDASLEQLMEMATVEVFRGSVNKEARSSWRLDENVSMTFVVADNYPDALSKTGLRYFTVIYQSTVKDEAEKSQMGSTIGAFKMMKMNMYTYVELRVVREENGQLSIWRQPIGVPGPDGKFVTFYDGRPCDWGEIKKALEDGEVVARYFESNKDKIRFVPAVVSIPEDSAEQGSSKK